MHSEIKELFVDDEGRSLQLLQHSFFGKSTVVSSVVAAPENVVRNIPYTRFLIEVDGICKSKCQKSHQIVIGAFVSRQFAKKYLIKYKHLVKS